MIIAENTTRPLGTPPTCPRPQKTTLCNWQRSWSAKTDRRGKQKASKSTQAAVDGQRPCRGWRGRSWAASSGRRARGARARERVVLRDHAQQHRLLLKLRQAGRRIHLRRNARKREGADGAKGRDAWAVQGRLAGDRAAGGHAPCRCRRLPHVLTVVYLLCAGNQSARLPCACARAGCKGRTWSWGVGRAVENTSSALRRRSEATCA